MGRSSVLLGLAVVVGAPSLGGCSAYDRRFAYDPAPAAVETTLPSGADTVRTLATVIGVRRGDAVEPAAVEIRLLVENHSPDTWVELDPLSLTLVSGDLQRFGDPTLIPPEAVEVAPGSSSTLTALFPLPPEAYEEPFDLDGLNLRWSLRADGQASAQHASFRRRPYYHYYYPRYSFGIRWGYGHGHFHHWYGGHYYWCD